MGVAYPSAIFAAPDGSGYTYSITAKITWDSSYYVTVESVWSDELSASQFSWRIKGRASQGDTNTYAEKYVNSGFQGTANKEYILQGCCTPGGTYDNSGSNYIFKLTSDSSSSGGGSSSSGTPCGKIYISKGEGVKSVKVYRFSSGVELYDGDQIYTGDNFDVFVKADVGYELDLYPMAFDLNYPNDTYAVPIDGTNLSLNGWYGDDNPVDVHVWSASNVSIRATASVKINEYTLSSTTGIDSYVTVRRISSKKDDAELGVLSNNATLYSADVLEIIVGAKTGYVVENVNISGCVANNNGTYTVVGNTTINVSVNPQYGVYIDNGTSWVLCMPYIDNGTTYNLYN